MAIATHLHYLILENAEGILLNNEQQAAHCQ